MKNLIQLLDPQTYDLNRSAVCLGLVAATGLVVMGMKLLEVLRNAGLPS